MILKYLNILPLETYFFPKEEKPSQLNLRELLITGFIGAILVEKYAIQNDKTKFIAGFLVGIISNFLSWKGSIPKSTTLTSGFLAGTLAVNYQGLMQYLGTTSTKLAAGSGVFLGSVLPSILCNMGN